MNEVKQSNGDIILFIDEVHMLMLTKAANILKTAFSRGELQMNTRSEDRALERRFQPLKVPEPSISEAIYEIYHKLKYTHAALVGAVELSKQLIRKFLHFGDQYLPDKAINLIDEAGAFVRMGRPLLPEEAKELYKDIQKITNIKAEAIHRPNVGKDDKTGKEINTNSFNRVVTEVEIQYIVSSWTGIPVMKVSTSESKYLLKMEEALCKHVIGQETAVKAICRALRRARLPIGPTGVGKAQLAKVLAAEYFGSKDAMIRFDMSELMEMHTVSKLIEGGKLTEAVRHHPYTVVLLDEIEKAHCDVFNIMLQILGDGRLTDSKGKTVNFTITVIIMTSNIGNVAVRKGGRQQIKEVNAKVGEELKMFWRLEFLNRFDDIIIFRQLTKEEVRKIAEIMVKEVITRLKKKDIYLHDGYNPTYGARTLRRAIVRLLEENFADKILAEEIKEGDSVTVDIDVLANFSQSYLCAVQVFAYCFYCITVEVCNTRFSPINKIP
ncbi:hypothetical protein NE237_010544 [Protea cynaroides]|uniref:Clp ATPase C-terminal domain-containing protein n=1 Tax=Protea cynaroides TaxID=273540 RepID=A0A9Q0L0K9_9MAGN|nr:hypothetical protein NE237_010544 [Protea cynaroides]